jgi:hypothetical protein
MTDISSLLRHQLSGFFRSLLLIIVIFHSDQAIRAAENKPHIYEARGLAKRLSPETLREIFFMRLTTWPDGSPIRVFVLPDNHPLHIRFAKEVLGVYPFQLRAAWDRLIYSGTGLSPTLVDTVAEMRERIERTPGGIGYVSN